MQATSHCVIGNTYTKSGNISEVTLGPLNPPVKVQKPNTSREWRRCIGLLDNTTGV